MRKMKMFCTTTFLLVTFITIAGDCGQELLDAYDVATVEFLADLDYCDNWYILEPELCIAEANLSYDRNLDDAYEDWVNC